MTNSCSGAAPASTKCTCPRRCDTAKISTSSAAPTGVGGVFDALRDVADAAGLNVHGTDVGKHPKMRLRVPAEGDGVLLRIKLEINTHETSPAHPLERIPFEVSNPWFTGQAQVLTFTTAELVATKLRALFQRSKGRDLFDLWLALTQLRLDPGDILTGFPPYRPTGYTSVRAIQNLHAKLEDQAFRTDLDLLVSDWPDDYEIDAAAELIIDTLLNGV